MTDAPRHAHMQPWHRVVIPRAEVRAGRSFNPDEFAVALEQVIAGTAPTDYQDPQQFFARTYLTAAMREQLGIVLRRLAGETEGTPPVLSFVTPFGGGKTHTLTALWHLAHAGPGAANLPGMSALLAQGRMPPVPQARVGIFVGNAWDPQPDRQTPWADIAHQLGGGAPAFTEATTPPSTVALTRLFSQANAPVLILMDEVLNFMNRHRALADGFFAFLDNLVRAAIGTRHVAVVLSLPNAAAEMTQYEQDWQDRITKTVKRVARDLIASEEAEFSAIVRRRLFESVGPPQNLAAVAKAYAAWCIEHRPHLPAQWAAADAETVFAACYPFHPATLSVFQRKWRSLPQFQHTRGALSLLAQWVGHLHTDPSAEEPLITLGSAPLHDPTFRVALLGQLGAPRLTAAIEADIVGATAQARALDADAKGPLAGLHRHTATAILLESAGGQADLAAHLPELRFALGSPEIDTTSIDNAAAALAAHAYYTRPIGADGYRIDARAKLLKVVADKRASLDVEHDVLPEARRLVRSVFEAGNPVALIPFPADPASMRNTPRLALVIADPTLQWDASDALRRRLAEWTYRRSNGARLFPAALIWCLRRPGASLFEHVETALAWRAVRQDLAAALLSDDTDPDEVRSIDASVRAAEADAKEAVWASYTFLAFADRALPDRLRVLDLGAGHSSSRETLAGRALAALRTHGLLDENVGPSYLERNWPTALATSGAWPLSGLRQAFLDGSLIRLLDVERALRARIPEWVEQGRFGLAAGAERNGRFRRTWFAELLPPEPIRFDADTFLLKPDIAHASRSEPQQTVPTPSPSASPVTLRVTGSPEAVAALEKMLHEQGLMHALTIARE